MRYIIGLIGFPLGMIMIIYRERVKQFTGDLGFAEKWFGPGGTYTVLAVFGFIISIASLMYMFGTLQSLFKMLFSPFFGI